MVVADLPSEVREFDECGGIHANDVSRTSIMNNERRLLLDVLQETSWNKKLAAKKLGISRSTLYNKLKKYSIRQPRKKR